MKKSLLYLLIILSLSFGEFVSTEVGASTQSESLAKIENNFYGFEYSKDSAKERVERLEQVVYGKTFTGDINKRITKLSADISADVIGLEIPPVEDTFKEDDSEIAKADSTVNYPIVDEIEQKLFNQTYKERDFHTRIVTIERKLFGKIYDVDDYSTRMDRIKAEVMPDRLAENKLYGDDDIVYRGENLNSADLGGTGFSKFRMPFGQKNYSRPYVNYGDETGGAATPFTNNNPNLNDELAQLEYETFGTEFSNEDTATRIQRLNSVSKAQKSSQKYDSQKFSQRMSTAMEIGAMILMILAMVL